MSKSIIVKTIYLLILISLLACSKSPETKLEVSTSYLMAGTSGGAALYLTNLDRKFTRTIILENNETTLAVENGNWEFVSILWDGNEPLTGDLKCDRKTASLTGTATRIELTPSQVNCDDDFYSPPEFRKDGDTRSIRLVNCASTTSISAGVNCDDSARGMAESYRIRLVNSEPPVGFTAGATGLRLSSDCIPAEPAPNSITETNLQLPFGGKQFRPAYAVDTFQDSNCTTPLLSFRLIDGLARLVPGSSVTFPSTGTDPFSDLFLETSIPQIGSLSFTGTLGTSLTNTGTLTNSTSRPITELKLNLPPGFTYQGGVFPGTGALCVLPLDPGDSCTFSLMFSPASSGLKIIPMTIDFNNGHPKKTVKNISTYSN